VAVKDCQLVGKCNACLGVNGVYLKEKEPLLLFAEYYSNTFYLKKPHMGLTFFKNEFKKSSRLGVKTGWYRIALLNFRLQPIKKITLLLLNIK
jgi:hypothetical protein